ncbi:MAG: right-handed parallel beta-helix repeat-containing protein [Acidovorax sp.]|nr:right-handed parallel beta-helix repeat-containing protein [Acidovorax sp.]
MPLTPIRPLSAVLLAGLWCSAAQAATFTVTEAGDDIDNFLGDGLCVTATGGCSLRAALLEATVLPGSHRIEFNIPTAPGMPAVIAPLSALPAVVAPIVIDGTTQPGSSANTLAVGDNAVINVRLDGANAGASHGLMFDPNATGSVLRGLAVTRFGRSGVYVSGASGVAIAGNFIGTDGGDSGALANVQPAILVDDGAAGTQVGTGAPADRNLIVGNTQGVALESSPGTQVRGNYIGTNRAGTTRVGTETGIRVLQPQGPGSGIYGNVIGASQNGIVISDAGSRVSVQGNLIGVGADGAASIGGAFSGISITGADPVASPSFVRVGGGDPGEPNTIANWGTSGIRAQRGNNLPAPPALRALRFMHNSIHSNGGLGIELIDNVTGQGAAPGDAVAAVNGGIVPPTLQSASGNAQGSTASFAFTGAPLASYVYEVFANTACDASGWGEGQAYLGELAANTDAGGSSTGSIALPPVPAGTWLTMTATRNFSNGNNDFETSEFSQCVQVQGGAPVHPGGGNVAAVPMLGHAGLALLSMLLGLFGLRQRRRD